MSYNQIYSQKVKDINKILFNSTEYILIGISESEILGTDLSSNESLAYDESFKNTLSQLKSNKDFENKFIKNYIKKYIESYTFQYDIPYSVKIRHFKQYIKVEFTNDDEQKINNFILINYDRFHERIIKRINQINTIINSIINKPSDNFYIPKQQELEERREQYKNDCERAKRELINKKAHLKTKASLNTAREIIKQVNPSIKEDDIRLIYEEFVKEYISTGKIPILRDGRPEIEAWFNYTCDSNAFLVEWGNSRVFAKEFIEKMLKVFNEHGNIPEYLSSKSQTVIQLSEWNPPD